MRRDFPRKVKAEAIKRAGGKCQQCSAALKPGEGEVDHILPDILGGEPILSNAQVLCRVCHAEKTAIDISRTRKADRQRDKATRAVRPSSKLSAGPKAPKTLNKQLPPRVLDVYRRPIGQGLLQASGNGDGDV